jgi:hypothetical protein
VKAKDDHDDAADARDQVARVKQHAAQDGRCTAKEQDDDRRHAEHKHHCVHKDLEPHRKRDGFGLGHCLNGHEGIPL